jgi:hypothetical protein
MEATLNSESESSAKLRGSESSHSGCPTRDSELGSDSGAAGRPGALSDRLGLGTVRAELTSTFALGAPLRLSLP